MRRVAAAVALAAFLGCTGGPGASFAAPAGRILAVVESIEGVRLSLLNTDGTIASQGPSVGIRSEGSVDSTGTQIAFSQTVSLPFGGFGRDSDLLTADFLGRFQGLTEDRSNEERPSWAPDGRRIAFASDRNGNWDVYAAPLRAITTAVDLTPGSPAVDRNPRWSPDGRSIAFETRRDGNFEVYVMHADGSAPVNVTKDPAADRLGDWSPDSSKLVFVSDRGGNDDLYALEVASGAVHRITTEPGNDTHPAWSPDGKRIAFSSDRDGDQEIFLIGADGAGEGRVTDNASEDIVQDWQPLRDLAAPVVTALPSSSRRGGPVRLRYRVREDTRRAALAYTLDFGPRSQALIGGFLSASRFAPDRVYTITIPQLVPVALLPSSFRFCLVAVDPSANTSRESCARFRFRA
jgi:dipeptidyl aminopeptidase/acylaminoacyl peptidase